MMPDGSEGGWGLVLARALAVGAQFSVFGALTFQVLVAPRGLARLPAVDCRVVRQRLQQVALVSIGVAWLALPAWLVAQAAYLGDAHDAAAIARAVAAVLGGTFFGHLLIAQAAVSAGLGWAVWRSPPAKRPVLSFILAAILVGLQAGHSHAAVMQAGRGLLLAVDVLHLWGAGAWLGGLLPLLMVVRGCPPRIGATTARWFSPLGQVCIAILVVTAAIQGWVMVGSLPGLVGTAYGRLVLAKLALLCTLLGFAAINRYRFAPALLRQDPDDARGVLMRSIAVQTAFGVATILAAALLAGLPPAMHVQPVWPFPLRLSFDAVNEAPDFRREVVGAALALGGATLLAGIALLPRWGWRVRWAAAIGAVGIAAFAIPHFDLLFVPAMPTSYYRSPIDFRAETILRGAALFPTNCAACHGLQGHGDGPAAASLPIPPADLTASHLWMHSDGELFWWLAHGIAAPDGRPAMPGFARVLSDQDRWALIDYIRAHNAGLAFHSTGRFPVPVQAPDLQARCVGGRVVTLADLRGGFVRLVFGPPPPAGPPGLITISITADPRAMPSKEGCAADDAAVPAAYAIVTGIAPRDLPGAQILIDRAGWLRDMRAGDRAAGWNDADALAAEMRNLKAAPAAMPMGMCDAHMAM